MQGTTVGSWSPNHRLILDRSRDGVICLYGLNDVNTKNVWRGLMELTFVRTTTPISMQGTWEVIGPEYHGAR